MMPEPMSTSLGELSEHDWNVISSRWSRGINWTVAKAGRRRWEILGRPGKGFPLFATKTAAYDAATALLLRESTHRAWRQAK